MQIPAPQERPPFMAPRPPVHARTAVLLLTCPDAPGIVAAVSDFLYGHGGNIVSVDQHADREDGQFFQRIEFELAGFALADEAILGALAPVAARFGMTCAIHFAPNMIGTHDP